MCGKEIQGVCIDRPWQSVFVFLRNLLYVVNLGSEYREVWDVRLGYFLRLLEGAMKDRAEIFQPLVRRSLYAVLNPSGGLLLNFCLLYV
jgi:hypothetical protein